MTFLMRHGVTLHTGSAVQEVEVKYGESLSEVLGMVDGRTEIVAAFPHTTKNTGSVKGKGDITISPGLGSAGLISGAGITGGLTHIGEVSQKETLGTEAEWNYSFQHMPEAA